MKIVADDKIPFLNGVLEPFCDVEYIEGKYISRENIKDADALIIRTRTKCNAELLDGTSVKFIATATIGFDHIDTKYCKENRIQWTNAPGCNSGSVQQWFMAAILYFAKENKIDLTTRTLGIVGVGNVGRKILRFTDSLGLRVLINDPPRARKEGACGFNTMNTIQKECDIITFHVPLNTAGDDKTYHLVDEQFLSKLNPGSLLINSSRGEVIDNVVLNENLKKNTACNAILDVWENEPELNLDLLKNSFLSTPHIAGYSLDGKANGTAMSVQSISKVFRLPYTDWYPDEIPAPEIDSINIDAKKKSRQQLITEVILHTYNIKADSDLLKTNWKDFEKQRGNYPLRREPAAYTVNIKNDNRNYKIILERLGFKVVQK
ncbi:MAG: 4-phosphoerythronate dehydrogenase PdxB [Bacteroidales bacterium]|nr:4-phosphoerythronate dehydrogenase PdxB [Bacteroidales bacterium]MBN2819655.1 4-phosphoerythronate dehydrogenase PdxB [Bacteroidales bacterium]